MYFVWENLMHILKWSRLLIFNNVFKLRMTLGMCETELSPKMDISEFCTEFEKFIYLHEV